MAEEATSLKASTAHGIMKVLYGYVPSLSLLASVKIVANTVNNDKSTQLAIFSSLKGGTYSLFP
jgi:F0F1-type ATP synthase epsilon subunit